MSVRRIPNNIFSIIQKNIPLSCVDAILINKKNEFLLVKRSIPPYKNKWCLPGGIIKRNQKILDKLDEIGKKELGIKFLRAGAYKPRSSPYSFQGLKEKGIEYLADVKKALGIKIVTEAKDTHTLPLIAEVADIVQIGARNMQNFSLLEEAGKIRNPILLKRGLAAKMEDLLMSAEYILSQGNYNVILCERGIRTFETHTRNTLDLNIIPVIKKHSHLPIIVDPSHGVGIWDKVTPMAMAAVACGADGLMIEVHSHPEEALSDGFQSLTIKNFKNLLEKIEKIASVVDKRIDIEEIQINN